MTPLRLDEGSEREAFEAWARTKFHASDISLDEFGGYYGDNVAGAWEGWQASLSIGRLGGEAVPADEPVAWHIDTHGVACVALKKSDLGLLAERYARPLGFIGAAPSAPDGWKLVPTTPTKEMIEAAMHVKRVRLLDVVAQFRAGIDETEARTPAIVGEWEAMLAVAPPAAAAKPQGDKSHG